MSVDSNDPQRLGKLSIVATPIGNLGDITLRAIETLQSSDFIACEDTRHSGRLLKHLDISKKLISVHDRNEASRVDQIVELLDQKNHISLVSDAGHPGMSDPGQRLIHAISKTDHLIEIIPGTCSIPAALSASGFPYEKFYFGGFLTTKKGRRTKELEKAISDDHTSVFFESPHRIAGTLEILTALEPTRAVCVARELTKKFETFHRGTAIELSEFFSEKKTKGEIVLIIAGAKPPKWFNL